MSKRSPQSSSFVERVRRHWLLAAIASLAFVALWAGQPAQAADVWPNVNQTVPPATPRPEVPPPDNKDKKKDKHNDPTQVPEQKVPESTPEITLEAAQETTLEATVGAAEEITNAVTGETVVAAEETTAANQAPESLPATGGETSLLLIAGVAGMALLLLAGAVLATR